jgi:hypothetical protein
LALIGVYITDHNELPQGDGTEQNFLDRERAALGDDADLFATPADKIATVEEGEDDLLGGDFSAPTGGTQGEEDLDFASSFPAIDNRNEVSRTM